jgi:phosphohistidine phosphatase
MADLLVMRHAKSDWGADYGNDHQRPLAPRGIKAARRIGRFLSAVGLVPGRVLCSSARRATTTVELAAEAGGWRCPIEIESGLYHASPGAVIEAIASAADGVDGPLLVIGHQPTMSEVVGLLIGGAEVRMPTAAVACLGNETECWQVIDGGCAELRWLVNPRLLRGMV